MSKLRPVAIDLETTGLTAAATITVLGVGRPELMAVILNADGTDIDPLAYQALLDRRTTVEVSLTVVDDERAALTTFIEQLERTLDSNRDYLTAFNGETWNGGFDLPFLRTKCAQHAVAWPDIDVAYADMLDIVDRFVTDDHRDLVGVHEHLIGNDVGDPFDESEEAVAAYRDGRYDEVLRHNVADLTRTLNLARLAELYVPRSDFKMKNLTPPGRHSR